MNNLCDQTFIHAKLVIGSRQVRFTTGRKEKNGEDEVLLRAVGTSDRDAMRRCRAFLDHALIELHATYNETKKDES